MRITSAELLDGLLSCDFGECMKPCSQGDIGYAKSLMGVARNELSMADTVIMIRYMPSVRFLRLKPLLITVMRTLDSFMSM